MTRAFRGYVTFVVATAALLAIVVGWELPGGDSERFWNAAAAFLVLAFFSEASYFKLKVGRAETQSSVAFIPFFAALMIVDIGWAAMLSAGAMLGVEVLVRKKPPIRVVFNVAQIFISVAITGLVYSSLGGPHSLRTFVFVPVAFAGAVGTYFLVNSVLVSGAVATWHGERIDNAWTRIVGSSLVYDIVTSLLAPVLAYFYIAWQIAGILLLVVPIYLVRHLYQVTLQLEQVNRDLLELMVKAIEARDPYTSGHSLRVSRIAEILAKDSGLSRRHVDQIRTAALLHDVGKIHEEYAALLRKEGKLDGTEKALMQTHSVRSAELVSTISAFKGDITDAVRHHHENFDGTGYPDGLSGRAIPFGSRIIMIADTIDAMTTDRPYRRALSYDRVAQELRKYARKQFDPELVDTVLKSDAIRRLVENRVETAQLPSSASVNVPSAPDRIESRVLQRRAKVSS